MMGGSKWAILDAVDLWMGVGDLRDRQIAPKLTKGK
jgi:hypothetical protein